MHCRAAIIISILSSTARRRQNPIPIGEQPVKFWFKEFENYEARWASILTLKDIKYVNNRFSEKELNGSKWNAK